MALLSRLLLGGGVVALSGVVALWRPVPLDSLDRRVFDALVRADATTRPPTRTAVVTIDEGSMTRFGQWPWPRDVLASLVERLHAMGAAVIALDILFAEAERGAGPGDARFALALARHPSVVGHTFVFEPTATAAACALSPLALVERQRGDQPPSAGLTRASGAICTLPALSTAAGASGFINVATDPDGLLRRLPLLLRLGEDVYPALSLAAARHATGNGPVVLDARMDGSMGLTLGTRTVTLDARGRLLLRPTGPWSRLSAADVLDGGVPDEAVAGRVVFVGASASGLRDVVATVRNRETPGVEVHAAAAETLLGGPGYHRPEWTGVAELGWALSASALVAGIALRHGIVAAGATALVVAALSWWMAAALVRASLVISPTWAVIALAITLVGEGMGSIGRERRRADRERRRRDDAQRLIVQTLTTLTETRDGDTGRHARRTQDYTRLLAAALATTPAHKGALSDDRVELLATLAPLHDIGKVGITDAVLRKPGLLTVEEQAEMRRHPDLGYGSLLKAEALAGVHDNEVMALAKEIVRTHHERWDGTGYPRGLRGHEIPLSGRIVALVDAYDAMVEGRAYRDAVSHQQAVDAIVSERGRHFDPAVVDAFLRVEADFRDWERPGDSPGREGTS